eukprot:COSAG06_NODE_26803_length_607_cov_0.789370_1_plen_48_part_01
MHPSNFGQPVGLWYADAARLGPEPPVTAQCLAGGARCPSAVLPGRRVD